MLRVDSTFSSPILDPTLGTPKMIFYDLVSCLVNMNIYNNIGGDPTQPSLAEPIQKRFRPTVGLLRLTITISRIPPFRGHTKRCEVHRARVTKVSAKKSEALAHVTSKTRRA